MIADARGRAGLALLLRTLFPLFLIFFGCGISTAVCAENPPAKYDPLLLSGGVPSEPGALSWSPGSRQIAFIHDGITIYDKAGGKRRNLRIKDVSYLDWISSGRLLAIYEKGGHKVLCIVDPGTLATSDVDLGQQPEGFSPLAAYGLRDGRRIVVITLRMEVLAIGTDLRYRLLLHDITRGTTKEISAFGRVFPSRNPDAALNAWIYAGPDPVEERVLVFEHIKPPVGKLYTRVSAIDWATGESTEITDSGRLNSLRSASWSTDGRRLAVVDGKGDLEIAEPTGLVLPVDEQCRGLFPSWNPAGSQIFIGGSVIDADGKNRISLFSGSDNNAAAWSDDGRELAIVSEGNLWLLRNFSPYFVPPDRPSDEKLAGKVSALRELFLDGLITRGEYDSRYKTLAEGAK